MDTVDTQTRSRMMASVRQKDTCPEVRLRKAVHRRGLRFRIQQRLIPGSTRTADIVFTRARLAIFVDGCFWHACPIHGSHPKSNADWWRRKISANVERDRDTDERLCRLGWRVLRVWEHEDIEVAAERVIETYRECLKDPS